MWNRQYKVTLQTPLGERYGKMTVTINHGNIEGVLSILKEAGAFHGTIQENGNCVITGELFTLTRTILYEATGKIEKESLHLIVKGEKEQFELFGTAVDCDSSLQKEEMQ